jgi:hypothetical protein
LIVQDDLEHVVGSAVLPEEILLFQRPGLTAGPVPLSQQQMLGGRRAEPAWGFLDNDGGFDRVAGTTSDDQRAFVDGQIHSGDLDSPAPRRNRAHARRRR